MLVSQRKQLVTFLEECVVPSLRRGSGTFDQSHLKAVIKAVLSSTDDPVVACESSQVRLIRAAHRIDQNNKSGTLQWLLTLLLDDCQTEEEQSYLVEQVRIATTSLTEE